MQKKHMESILKEKTSKKRKKNSLIVWYCNIETMPFIQNGHSGLRVLKSMTDGCDRLATDIYIVMKPHQRQNNNVDTD